MRAAPDPKAPPQPLIARRHEQQLDTEGNDTVSFNQACCEMMKLVRSVLSRLCVDSALCWVLVGPVLSAR